MGIENTESIQSDPIRSLRLLCICLSTLSFLQCRSTSLTKNLEISVDIRVGVANFLNY